MAPNNQKRIVYNKESSFPDFTCPVYEDDFIKDADGWIAGKIQCDNAEKLWRIHDDIYDFSSFIYKHPGGAQWLKLTKGTDITEAFECHHISTFPKSILSQFYIRKASKPRNSPFTFKDDGFYRTLQRRVREELRTIPKGLEKQSKMIVDCLAVCTLVLLIYASRVEWMYAKVILTVITCFFIAWLMIAAHNFTHLRDNWRMYWYNLTFLSNSEWRVTHALSHHIFPNTKWDYELYVVEPIFSWTSRKSKSTFFRFAPIVYSIMFYPFFGDVAIMNRVLRILSGKNLKKFQYFDLVGFTIPLIMCIFGSSSTILTLIHWIIILHGTSLIFQFIGYNSAHHHPDVFHDGDPPCEDSDWGLHQLSAIMEREDINASFFLVLTRYGNHALHHLFRHWITYIYRISIRFFIRHAKNSIRN